MKNNNELNYFNETRKQELDKMIADFSDEGCMFVEDMFTEFNACFRRGYDRSNGRMTFPSGTSLAMISPLFSAGKKSSMSPQE